MDSEDSDQTAQMHRLIRVSAGRTGRFLGIAVHWLLYCKVPYLYIICGWKALGRLLNMLRLSKFSTLHL